jgi:dTDP-4-amino-4,6-dideoxygalactose transaminase
MERLQAAGIATRPGTQALHMLTYYRERFGYRAEDFPAARDAALHTMAIPLHNRMSEEDFEYVAAALERGA